MESTIKCKNHLMKKLRNRKFEGYESERSTLLSVIKRTIEFGESNSVLVLGPSGSGKTLMVQEVLNEVKADKYCKENSLIAELHGLCHTDDKLAFLDITKQLNVSLEDVDVSSADVLSNFLENLGNINNVKTLIFILEDFHAFCFHQSQTLLYYLFDNVQSKKVSLCVVGITNQLNVVELLEKRVESRFSGSQIFLFFDTDFKNRVRKLRSLLVVEKDSNLDSTFIRKWNKSADTLCENPEVIDILKEQFAITQNENLFTNFVFTCISLMADDSTQLTVDHVKLATEMFQSEKKVDLLASLSLLEFCLLVSIYHHSEIFENKPFSFEIIYQRYLKFTRNAANAPRAPKQIIVQCLEMLTNLHLIVPVADETIKSVGKEFALHKMLITSQDVKDSIRAYPDLPMEIREWAENILT